MAGNTNNNGSRIWWQEAGKEGVLGLGVAEMVSIGVSLGVVGVADKMAPHLLKHAGKAVAKICIEPYLDTIEHSLDKVCKLEECKPDFSKPREERAENLARTLIVFSAAFVTSLVAKIATRKSLNKLLKIREPEYIKTGHAFKDFMYEYIIPHKEDRKVIYWDESIHYGSLILANTGVAKHTDHAIHAVSGMLQKFGVSEKKANQLASMAMIWEVPNILGWFAGAGRIAYKHYHTKDNVINAVLGSSHTPRTP